MKIIKLEKWISFYLLMKYFEMFNIKLDDSKQFKKDWERLNRNLLDKKKIKKYLEKLALNFPNISNIKRLQPKSEYKFRFRK
jgi:mRNA-degrading endonuclease YafQ of YafQ-DinJ toxin-antitoxin module